MTGFGRWLGEENGKEMLRAVFTDNCTKEQARAAVTTYCIIFDVNVDQRPWDELMRWIWDFYNSWFDGFDEMDDYFCGNLV